MCEIKKSLLVFRTLWSTPTRFDVEGNLLNTTQNGANTLSLFRPSLLSIHFLLHLALLLRSSRLDHFFSLLFRSLCKLSETRSLALTHFSPFIRFTFGQWAVPRKYNSRQFAWTLTRKSAEWWDYLLAIKRWDLGTTSSVSGLSLSVIPSFISWHFVFLNFSYSFLCKFSGFLVHDKSF